MLFRLFYRLWFTPWEGHPLAQSLRNLVEGNDSQGSPMLAAAALELGCGTGDASIYLAKRGWRVTAVDFVPSALEKARDGVEGAVLASGQDGVASLAVALATLESARERRPVSLEGDGLVAAP